MREEVMRHMPVHRGKQLFQIQPSYGPLEIRFKMNYEAKDVIYALQCGGCEKQYIGETGDLRARVRLHK